MSDDGYRPGSGGGCGSGHSAAEDEIEVVVQKVKPKVTGSDGHQPETKMTI